MPLILSARMEPDASFCRTSGVVILHTIAYEHFDLARVHPYRKVNRKRAFRHTEQFEFFGSKMQVGINVGELAHAEPADIYVIRKRYIDKFVHGRASSVNEYPCQK